MHAQMVVEKTSESAISVLCALFMFEQECYMGFADNNHLKNKELRDYFSSVYPNGSQLECLGVCFLINLCAQLRTF